MGKIFKIPAIIVYIIGSVWSFIVIFSIVMREFGLLGGVIAFIVFPVTLYIAPWYEGLVHANYFPVILIYGTTIIAGILYGIGSIIDRD